MSRTATSVSVASLALLAACPDHPSGNAAVLWLAPYESETHVQLVDTEPQPY